MQAGTCGKLTPEDRGRETRRQASQQLQLGKTVLPYLLDSILNPAEFIDLVNEISTSQLLPLILHSKGYNSTDVPQRSPSHPSLARPPENLDHDPKKALIIVPQRAPPSLLLSQADASKDFLSKMPW